MTTTSATLALASGSALATIAAGFGGKFICFAPDDGAGKGFVPAADFKALADKLAEVTNSLTKKNDELTKKAEEAMTEVKNKGALLDETKQQCDKLLVEQTVLTKEKNDLSARLTQVEQAMVREPGKDTKSRKTTSSRPSLRPALAASAASTGSRSRLRSPASIIR
jgi:hypothetical protein